MKNKFMSPFNRTPDLITRHHFWDDIVKAGVGIFTSQSADRNRTRMLNELKNNKELVNALQVPSIENLQMVVQQEISQGRLNPEMGQAILADPSAMESIGANPELVRAQQASLGALQNIAGQGGLDLQSRARLSEAQNQIAQQSRGQREALLAQQQRQGTLGSGQGLAAQLMAQQGAADRASQAGLQAAATADQRALEALMQSGRMAGDMRGQQFSEDEKRAQAMDRINRFNTKHRQELQASNRSAINAARRYNLDKAQGMERRNVDRKQKGAEQHADAYKTKYLLDKNKVDAQTGVGSALADVHEKKYNKMSDATSNILGGISFNQGGVVPGDVYAGDRIDAQLNSGEMVLNANQQQNLLDLLAGKTNSINTEVPIVEDTMVDNPLDVLANMNKKPTMADGGTVPPNIDEVDQLVREWLASNPTKTEYRHQESPTTYADDVPLPWDKYNDESQAGAGATTVPIPEPRTPVPTAITNTPPTPAPTTTDKPETDYISELLKARPQQQPTPQPQESSVMDKVKEGAGGLFEALSMAASPEVGAKLKEKKENRALQERMQQRGIDERERKLDQEMSLEVLKLEKENAEKLAAEEEAKKPVTFDKWIKTAKLGSEERRSIGLVASAAEGFFAAEKKILNSTSKLDIGRQLTPAVSTELKASLDQAASALVRNESGAAVPPEEMKQYLAMLPTLNDIVTGHEDIIKYKMQQFYNRIRTKFAVYPITFKEMLRGSNAKEGRDINKIVHKNSVYHQDYKMQAPKGLSKEDESELDKLKKRREELLKKRK